MTTTGITTCKTTTLALLLAQQLLLALLLFNEYYSHYYWHKDYYWHNNYYWHNDYYWHYCLHNNYPRLTTCSNKVHDIPSPLVSTLKARTINRFPLQRIRIRNFIHNQVYSINQVYLIESGFQSSIVGSPFSSPSTCFERRTNHPGRFKRDLSIHSK